MARYGTGSGNYIDGVRIAWPAVTSCTIGGWIKADHVPGATTSSQQPFGFSGGGGVFGGVYFSWDHSSAPYRRAWNLEDAGNYVPIAQYTALPANTWVHLLATVLYSGSNPRWTLTAYLNGVQNGTTGTSNDFTDFGNKNLFPSTLANSGYGAGSSPIVNGAMSDFAIWNVVLSVHEILSLGTGAARPDEIRPAALQLYWPLWGASGTNPEPDLSGAKTGTGSTPNNGVVAGTTVVSNPPTVKFRRG